MLTKTTGYNIIEKRKIAQDRLYKHDKDIMDTIYTITVLLSNPAVTGGQIKCRSKIDKSFCVVFSYGRIKFYYEDSSDVNLINTQDDYVKIFNDKCPMDPIIEKIFNGIDLLVSDEIKESIFIGKELKFTQLVEEIFDD